MPEFILKWMILFSKSSRSFAMSFQNTSTAQRPGLLSDINKVHLTTFLALDSIVTLFTVIGNVLFIVTMMRRRAMHIPSNILLAALSVGDMLVGVLAQPLWLAEVSYRLLRNRVKPLFIATYTFTWFLVPISFTFISLISIDRYVAICNPYWYHAKATCKTHAIIVLLAVIANLILYAVCIVLLVRKIETSITIWMVLTLAAISICITAVCNFKVFKAIRRSRKTISSFASSSNTEESRRPILMRLQERRTAVTMSAIVIVFFLCYMPFIIQTSLELLKVIVNRDVKAISNDWTNFFVLFNSMMNPIVYYVRLRSFRSAVKEIFCRNLGDVDTD